LQYVVVRSRVVIEAGDAFANSRVEAEEIKQKFVME